MTGSPQAVGSDGDVAGVGAERGGLNAGALGADAVLDDGALGADAGGLDDVALDMAQRLILSTDATVVRLLEACFGERVCTSGLEQASTRGLPTDVELELTGEETVLRRATLLQGCETGRNYVYAETAIVLDRLEPSMRDALLATPEPIGHLLLAARAETFRELVRTGRTPAGPRASAFGLHSTEVLLFRSYRMIVQGRPVMLVTEHFPPFFFPAGAQDGPRDAPALDVGS